MNVTEHRILLCGTELVYRLERKPVKNINLRVRPDGSVAVSAAPNVPMRDIEALLLAHALRVIEASRRGRARAERSEPSLNNQTTIRLFDEQLTLCVEQGRQNRVSLENDRIHLTVRDPSDEQLKRRVLDQFIDECCTRRIEQLCREISPTFAAMGVPFPKSIRFRRMRTRWGSCQPSKGALTFNLHLSEKPIAAVWYVVAHEFTHFLHPDHSKRFYACLECIMPDWKARRALLKD